MELKLDDIDYMKRVIQLAEKARGRTSPNPMVGTVIVKNGRIIAEGFHQEYGKKHAEIMAIDSASEPVGGATLYCNLEPCTNDIPNKKTPPCSERIIKEKISRVVIASVDPNPYINGKGIQKLKENNIRVELGLLAEESRILNQKYFTFMRLGRPFIHLKIAQSLDGRIATNQGQSRWITNESALKKVHELRAEYDAILVGINTVIQDNPSLTVRRVKGRNPYRIILDDRLAIPQTAQVVTDRFKTHTIIFTSVPKENRTAQQLTKEGIRIIHMDTGLSKYLNVAEVVRTLAEMNISSLLVEGGGEIFTSFLKANLFDKITFFISPMIIGTGIQSIGDLGITSLAQAYRLEQVKIEIIDHQAMVEGFRDYQTIIG
jgi:diaminohydroxyphosphoribosylaminopyrimidine deaminase/5-amino-6-(5-phosphoribosylamino)uracil reductase